MGNEEVGVIATIVLAILLCLGGIWYASASCNARGASFDEVEFGVVQGCMVKHNGRWLPLENIRGFDDKG